MSLMNIDIRSHIVNNFKGVKEDEIKASINASVEEKDEITLPGLGVFFELLWENSDENSKEYIINTLNQALN